ncbi:DUF1574 family protein [Adhaeribacter radiodurans]|uniref:DUF1574 family protein n=1 Tax=Adhaeribacter radiodurans TaxID=2745197 RepID=A0A7L7LAC3_9BACT|nr:DUF1574 family protein [Adhaeribacter radiodurans]QMU29687.1 DUF1574 family protein [Adhaeribacter radiodurans]
MKKLFVRISAVLVTCALTYFAIIYAASLTGFTNWLPNAKYTTGKGYYTLSRFREIDKFSNIDVLFLGSSQVYRGFDTRQFEQKGLKAFNLGTSAQSPYNSYFLLQEYLPKLKPKYIVLDLYWHMMTKEDVTESTVDLISNHELTDNIVDMALTTHDYTIISSLVSNYVSRVHTPLTKVREKKLPKEIYIPGGFVESTVPEAELAMTNPKKAYQFRNLDSKLKEPSEFQLEYLEKIIKLCKQNNTKLVFVLLPVTKEYKNNLTNYNDYINRISSVSKKNNVPFIDYNTRKGLSLSSSEDFLDKNHLSPSGASKLDKFIYQDLTSLGIKESISSL